MKKLSSILLIDDDITSNFLNELLLDRLGVAERVLVTENATQALALLQDLPDPVEPALMLLDVNMPGLSGIQFLEAYQQLPQARRDSTVIIMLSTAMDARDLGRLDELRIDGLASKPLTREKVNDILRLHFQRQLPEQ